MKARLIIMAILAMMLFGAAFIYAPGKSGPQSGMREVAPESPQSGAPIVGTQQRPAPHSPLNGRHADVYYARNLHEQATAVESATVSLKLDALLLRQYAAEICAAYRGMGFETLEALLKARDEPTPAKLASAMVVDRYRDSYCKGVSAQEPVSPDYVYEALAQASAAGDADARRLMRALDAGFAELPATERAKLTESLVGTVRQTQSPSMFLHTATALMGEQFNWSPTGSPHSFDNAESLEFAKLFGIQMAMCHEFNVCGRRSVYMMRACLPWHCDSANHHDYARRQLTGDQYDIATRYAEALRQLRATRVP